MRNDWLTAEAYEAWEDRLGRRLALWDLNVLKVCSDLGSISRATKVLQLSKAAISKIVRSLESELEVALVSRSPRGIVLTEAGRVLLARSETAFGELEAAVGAISALARSGLGELRIAANEVAMSRLIGEVIGRFEAEWPDAIFEVIPAYTRTAQLYELEQGNVELVVGQVVDSDQHILAEELFRDGLVVVASPNSPWAKRDRIELAELLDERWAFFPPNSVSGRTMRRAFLACGLPLPKIMVVGSSLQLLWRLVIDNEFLALYPRSLARASRSLTTLPVAVSTFWHPIGILTIKHRTLSPLAHRFIEVTRKVVGESGIFAAP